MKQVIKGTLLWITIISVVLFIGSIDSIMDKGVLVFLMWLLACISLCVTCRRMLSIEDLTNSFIYRIWNKLLTN